MHIYSDDSTLKCEERTEYWKTETREEAQEKHTTTPLTPREMEEEREGGAEREKKVGLRKRRNTPTQSFLH